MQSRKIIKEISLTGYRDRNSSNSENVRIHHETPSRLLTCLAEVTESELVKLNWFSNLKSRVPVIELVDIQIRELVLQQTVAPIEGGKYPIFPHPRLKNIFFLYFH